MSPLAVDLAALGALLTTIAAFLHGTISDRKNQKEQIAQDRSSQNESIYEDELNKLENEIGTHQKVIRFLFFIGILILLFGLIFDNTSEVISSLSNISSS